MDKSELLWLFEECLNATYATVEDGGSFALQDEGDRLFVFFEKSNGLEDWQNNLDFSAVPGGDQERHFDAQSHMSARALGDKPEALRPPHNLPMNVPPSLTVSVASTSIMAAYSQTDKTWYCHGGFLRVWKSILPYIAEALTDPRFREIVIVGYSHGAAIAVLCHEYVWFHRTDLRGSIFGFGFGCPRVIWGNVPDGISRWQNFFVIRNVNDLVTHLPPRILGYHHVGSLINIGAMGNYSSIDAHRAENYIEQLKK